MHEPKRLVQTNHSVHADTPGYMRTYIIYSSSLDQQSRSAAFSFVFMLGPTEREGDASHGVRCFGRLPLVDSDGVLSSLSVVRASSLVWSVGYLRSNIQSNRPPNRSRHLINGLVNSSSLNKVTPGLSYGRVYVEQQTRTSWVLLILATESREQRDAWAPRRHDVLYCSTTLSNHGLIRFKKISTATASASACLTGHRVNCKCNCTASKALLLQSAMTRRRRRRRTPTPRARTGVVHDD